MVLLSLALSACGGGSDDPTAAPDDSSGGGGDSTPVASTATAESDRRGNGDGGASGEAGTATATVGDETRTIAMRGDAREMCNPNFGGTFVVSMFGTDDDGNEIAFSFNAPGDVISVQAGTTDISGELWIFRPRGVRRFPDTVPERITGTATIDGSSASGTATFYEDRALQGSRQSGSYNAGVREVTFSATC